jgi:hypothetical protein
MGSGAASACDAKRACTGGCLRACYTHIRRMLRCVCVTRAPQRRAAWKISSAPLAAPPSIARSSVVCVTAFVARVRALPAAQLQPACAGGAARPRRHGARQLRLPAACVRAPAPAAPAWKHATLVSKRFALTRARPVSRAPPRRLLLGYVYPAYACFKALERRKPDGIRAWCEYWCAQRALSSRVGCVQTLFSARSLRMCARAPRCAHSLATHAHAGWCWGCSQYAKPSATKPFSGTRTRFLLL